MYVYWILFVQHYTLPLELVLAKRRKIAKKMGINSEEGESAFNPEMQHNTEQEKGGKKNLCSQCVNLKNTTHAARSSFGKGT